MHCVQAMRSNTTNVNVYDAVVMTATVAVVHPVNLTNADSAPPITPCINRLGL